MKKVALGVDVRSGQDISGLEKDLEQMDQKGIKYEILFLDAKDSVLVKRYKETRRQHPLSGSDVWIPVLRKNVRRPHF